MLVGRLIPCALGSSPVLGRLVIRRCRLSRRGVLLVRDMELEIRVVMSVLATVLLDVPRWIVGSGIVEVGEGENGGGPGCLAGVGGFSGRMNVVVVR